MITVVLLAFWTVLAGARKTPIGRFLHYMMVEQSAAALNRVTRGHILLVLVLIAVGSLVACYGDAEAAQILSMAVPDAAAWLTTFEVSVYLDTLAALAAASAAMRLRGARNYIVALCAPLMRRSATVETRPRCSRRRTVNEPANDDEDGTEFALATQTRVCLAS